jgi:dienelactone hydrolase
MQLPQSSRRQWLAQFGAAAGAAAVAPWWNLATAAAAEEAVPFLNRFPRMLHEGFVDCVRQIMTARNDRIFALKSRADAEAYISDARAKIGRSFGIWPERTPLNPQVTGVVERDAYRIENVIFESRPQFYVTANLYLPKKVAGKIPGVVGSCGHSANGKAHTAYQSFAQGLARQGYACLIFDPIGQGERLQYVDENLKPRVGTGTSEHMMAGNQQAIVGEFFGSWRAWDGMRALDYLLSREEVDPKHVGITGNSGGGTMTTWLCGVESRWTMGAPSCFVTSFLRNLENELPADTEQCPPHVLAQGLDHGDFIACMAPKPVVILTQERDYFDVRGGRQTFEQLKHIYKLLGKPENIQFFTGPGPHGYAQDAREAMYACFNRATGLNDPGTKEPALTLEEDSTLQCTQRGQVVELKGRTIYSYTAEKAETLAAPRAKSQPPQATIEAVKQWLGTRAAKSTCDYRILRPRSGKGHPLPSVSTFVLQSTERNRSKKAEVDVPTIVYRWYDAPNFSRPPQGESQRPAILYISHDSSDAEIRDDKLVAELFAATKEPALYACDVRGIGDTRPNTCGENAHTSSYGSDYFYSAYALMLGESLVAQRVQDVCRAIDFVRDHGGHREIHLVAKGFGTIPAALAALVRSEVKQITLKNGLTSYVDLAKTDVYKWPVSTLPTGVLEHFDLPEVYAALEAKGLKQIDPIGPADKVPTKA